MTLAALAILAVWLWVTLPLALGQQTLFFRDVLGNHFALKAFGAAELAEGRIPAFNPTLGLGQPFRGNPSALAFYPGNVLYGVLPFWSAFNLHYALHWLLALVAMAVLARRLGLGGEAALLAGLTYAGCGWMLSALSFYNLLTVAAWWPLAVAGALAPGRRGVVLGGVACGMALLGGEPMTAALGIVPMLLLAVRHRGLLRGFLNTVAVGAVGLLVAAPQVVATARILGFSFRGTQGVGEKASLFTLPPLRLLETVLPLPFGWPLDVGDRGWWLGRTAPDLGYFLSLYAGIVALWLAWRGLRRRGLRRRGVGLLGLLALAGLAGAVVLGSAPELLQKATGGLFRFPEKLLFWYALALPLLAAHGLQRELDGEEAGTGDDQHNGKDGSSAAPSGPRSYLGACVPYRGAFLLGALMVVAGVAMTLLRPGWIAAAPAPTLLSTQTGAWAAYLLLGGGLLLGAVFALRHRAGAGVVALQLVALLQLFPLVRTVPTEPLRQPPPWIAMLGETLPGPPWAVLPTGVSRPPWEPPPGYRMPDRGTRGVNRLRNALDLYPAPGVTYGLTYPLAPDIEGLSSPLYSFLSVEVTRLDWPARAAWLRATGVQAVVANRPPATGALQRLDTEVRQGVPTGLYAVASPAPDLWWPERVVTAPGPRAALAAVAALDDPVGTVVAATAVEHRPGGTVRVVSREGDHVEIQVTGPGGLMAVRRSFHPLYRVRLDDEGKTAKLATQPVQLTLLGIEVPAGDHRVVIDVDDRPVIAGAAVSLLTLLVIVFVAWREGRP